MKPLTPASPHAIIMIGIPGAGKSTFAERFADTFQAPIVSGAKLQHSLNLSADKTDILRSYLIGEYLKTHRTIVIDGGYDRKTKRVELIRKLLKAGYRPLVVWVQTDTTEAHRRATKPYPKGSGISSDVFDKAVAEFQVPSQQEKPVVISGKHTYATQVKIILKQLAAATGRHDHDHPSEPEERPRARGIVIR